MDYDKQNKGPDDVEKSLELLDKVLSEFEDPDSLPPVEPESPSQGHQSEDDGYMSMNGRRAKFAPDFQPTDEVTTPIMPPHPTVATASAATTPSSPPQSAGLTPPSTLPILSATSTSLMENNETKSLSPPPPEEAEQIISDLLPKVISPCNTAPRNSPSDTVVNGFINISPLKIRHTPSPPYSDRTTSSNTQVTIIGDTTIRQQNGGENTAQTPESTAPLQTTLPKTRPSPAQPFRFGSLPSTSPPRGLLGLTDSLDGGRAVLGMGISAVHDAVLRGVAARIPETIMNEHPVTIYPGRASPHRRVPPRTLPGSIERHREVCRSGEKSLDDSPEDGTNNNDGDYSLSPSSSYINHHHIFVNSNLNRSRRKKSSSSTGRLRNGNDDDDESEDFSDDSLEDSSLPPPPPPPVIPPPPSLSCPVTPSKRGSIAWDINLDDPESFEDPLSRGNQRISHNKILAKRRGRSVSGSQSSLASTPGQSTESNKISGSVEWPDPPEPPICSTEDEAASIYSDSDDINQMTFTTQDITDGRGTYVIRKGRKQRQRLSEMDSMSSINSKLSNEGCNSINVPSPVFPASMMIPSSRHSVDLGSTSPPVPLSSYLPNSLNSPRSRLSLDLSSPTSELPATNTNIATSSTIISPRYTEFKSYSSTFDGLQALENINLSNNNISLITNGSNNLNNSSSSNVSVNANVNNNLNGNNGCGGLPLMRVSSLPAITPPINDVISTPRRELAPPIEEDEEQDSESQRGAPLRQIENNISALLRGDIPVRVSVNDIHPSRRPLGFRPGVHKSESAKEMLLSQQLAAGSGTFGPLPPSPPSSSPEMETLDGFPPLPPSPAHEDADNYHDVVHGIHNVRLSSRSRLNKTDHYYRDTIDHVPPSVPPHRGSSMNTLKTRSMDAGFSKSYRNGAYVASPRTPGTLPPELPGSSSRRRLTSGAFPKRAAQSPREERRLQTSCSLPETPIFARGCDIPRTPHRRAPELPGTGSRTAPRNNTVGTANNNLSSIVGIGSGRQSITQALATGELIRMSGGPQRGWYPKQRGHHRPASTENLDRLHPQSSMRAWDAVGTGSRKPLTLPPNLTPKFFNKSPREALRRVTSLLIRSKGNSNNTTATNGPKEKESSKKADRDREIFASAVHRSPGSAGDAVPPPTTHKKKGFFKSFWKKSKHYSLEQ